MASGQSVVPVEVHRRPYPHCRMGANYSYGVRVRELRAHQRQSSRVVELLERQKRTPGWLWKRRTVWWKAPKPRQICAPSARTTQSRPALAGPTQPGCQEECHSEQSLFLASKLNSTSRATQATHRGSRAKSGRMAVRCRLRIAQYQQPCPRCTPGMPSYQE